ncbi:hypothetical protein BJV74DRAFT_795658 [Russula compacta]|nr:hypothetical protein BJV74DRAFT_795658 [Russula compacta]
MTDSDDEAEVMVTKPRPKPVPYNKQVATPVPMSEVKVKKESKAIAKVKGNSPISVTSNSNATPSASLNSLPEFAHSAWDTEFLPTLYKYLGSLEKPWELSKPKETDDVKTVQMILDIVYPCSNYKVTINDRIYIMVKDWINEKHSFFGSQAIKNITDFFKGDQFQNDPTKIAKYAIPPVGAVGMAAAAVEHAFLLFITGEHVEKGSIGNFSHKKVGHLVDNYIQNAKNLSNHRWHWIEESCGLKVQQDQPAPLNAPLMQDKCRALYKPSSPMNSNEE